MYPDAQYVSPPVSGTVSLCRCVTPGGLVSCVRSVHVHSYQEERDMKAGKRVLTRVPVLSCERVAEAERALVGSELIPNDTDTGQARDLRRRGVDLDFTEVSAKVTLLRRRKVLIAEEDDGPLCDKESKLWRKRSQVRCRAEREERS